jgi:hypothetical protein
MFIGQEGKVCGRKCRLVSIWKTVIRVFWLEPSERAKMLDDNAAEKWLGFESNVSRASWSTR